MTDGNPSLDSDIFVDLDLASQTKILKIQSDDIGKSGVYNLRLTAKYNTDRSPITT